MEGLEFECEGGIERGDCEDRFVEDAPFTLRVGDKLDGSDVETRRPDGTGMLFRGVVSRRYGCCKHWRLVKRASGSYLRRSRMQ